MSVGKTLRDERIRLSIDLDNLSKNTRISRKHLEAIEADQPENCPGVFFYRSFVLQYADAVGLEAAGFDADLDRLQRSLSSALQPGAIEPSPLKAPDSIVSATNRIYFSGQGKVWGSAVALIAVVMGCSVLYNWWRNVQAGAAQPRQDIVSESKAPPALDVPSAPALPISAPLTTSSDDVIVIAVTAREPVWISLSADGKPPFSGKLEPGQMRTAGSKDRVRLGVGSAGAVEVTMNGKSIGPIGASGQVRVVVFTPGGFRVLPPSGSVQPAPSDAPVDTGSRPPPTL